MEQPDSTGCWELLGGVLSAYGAWRGCSGRGSPLKKTSLDDIPLRRPGKAFQVEESGYRNAWDHNKVSLLPETDSSQVSLVQGHRREE